MGMTGQKRNEVTPVKDKAVIEAIARRDEQAVSAVMCLLYAFREYPELHLSGQDFHAEVCVYAQHLGQGLPMGLQFSVLAIGIIVMQRALVGFDIG